MRLARHFASAAGLGPVAYRCATALSVSGASLARPFLAGGQEGTEGSTGSFEPPGRGKDTPAGRAEHGDEGPPINPSVDSIRHIMGKVNEAAGEDYDFPETGGETIRAMASEIGGNLAAPVGRAAEATGGGVEGAVGAAVGAVQGAGRKVVSGVEQVVEMGKKVVGSSGERAQEALSQAASDGDRRMATEPEVGKGRGGGGDGGVRGDCGMRGMGGDGGLHGMGERELGPGGSVEGASAAGGAGGARGEGEEEGAGRRGGGRGTGGVDGRTATP